MDTKEMVKVALDELLHYPKRSMGWYVKRLVKGMAGRKTAPPAKISWPTGLLADALVVYYRNHLNSEESLVIMKTLKKYYDRWVDGKRHIYCLDDVLCGTALIDLEQITGDVKYRKAAEDMVAFLYQHEADIEGSLPYRPAHKNGHIYADSIGMICPFLCKYGHTYDDPNAIQMAVKQIKNFVSHGLDARTGLPYHGYECKSRVKYGIIGWGRAAGWLMMGMVDSLVYMDKGSAAYDMVKQAFRHMVDKVEAYQLESGLYPWHLPAKEGPVDTSATAMILYAIAKGLDHDILIGIHRSRMQRGRAALEQEVQGGRVKNSSAECGGFGIYPQQYGSYPWGLGPTLALFTVVPGSRGR